METIKIASTEDILKIVSQVCDPEIPVLSIKDLGIIREIKWDGNKEVEVFITPTYTGCPAMDVITVEIKAVLQEAGIPNPKVSMVWTPAWTTDWISEEGKQKMQDYGIAPPQEKTTDKSFLTGEGRPVPCPQCTSENTELISLFGSTACKSLYKCLDCKEPFDYFKCH